MQKKLQKPLEETVMSTSTQNDHERSLRRHLLSLLGEQWAHINFTSAVKDFPIELMHTAVPNLDHTAWDLVYHVHAAQRDILDYLRGGESYESPPYPDGFWPRGEEKSAGIDDWENTASSYFKDQDELRKMVEDQDADLFAPLFPGTGHTLLREILVLADHTSYHVGQIVDVRMLLGAPVRDY